MKITIEINDTRCKGLLSEHETLEHSTRRSLESVMKVLDTILKDIKEDSDIHLIVY